MTATVRREVAAELVAGWPPPTDEQLATLQRTIGAAVASRLRNTTPQGNPPAEGTGGLHQPTHRKERIS